MSRLLAGIALLGVAALYVVRLDYSPVYLLNDEIYNALQAWSLAETGRSAAGDRFPVFFRGLEFPPGRDPLCVYGTAAALTVLPLGEIALRLPTSLVGILNIVLIYVLASRLWGSRTWGVVAAALLATSPAHYIHSRIGIPTLWSLPLLLCWLLALSRYAEERQPKMLLAAFSALGLAAFGYLGTAVVVPVFAAATLAFMYFGLELRGAKPYLIAAAGLLLAAAPAVYWHFLHPERWSELASYYVTGDTVLRTGTPLLTPAGVPNFAAVQERVTSYWNYFDPTLLFLRGDASPRYSTGRAGVFLLPAMLLLIAGVARAARAGALGRLLVFGFLAAPFAGALANEVQVQRALPMVLFGVLLCTWGAVSLWSHPNRRWAITLLAVLSVLQFTIFVADYFGAYRLRSGPSRGGNLRGAITTSIQLLRTHAAPRLYLDANIDNAAYYWRFYAIALNASDLTPRVTVASLSDVLASAQSGAVFVTPTQAASLDQRAATGEWQLRARIVEPDNTAFYSVLVKR